MFKENDIKNHIYLSMLDDIITCQLKPGEFVKEQELSQRYKASRTPVREVIKRLALEHYIDVIPRYGNRISRISIEYVKQMIEMRITLECKVISNLVIKNNDLDTTLLSDSIETQRHLLDKNYAFKDFFKLDNEFHKIIFQLGHKMVWWGVLENFTPHYSRFRMLRAKEENNNRLSFVQHKEIYSIIKNRDLKSIESTVKNHVLPCLTNIPLLLEEYPSYFDK